MPELTCWSCGAVLGGFGSRGSDGHLYCGSGTCEGQEEEGEDREPEMPEEDYDTREERDIDRLDCPENQFD